MSTVLLDFDKPVRVHIKMYQKNHYDKIFFVKKNGVDYDWANVTEVILEVKKKKNDTDKILELKKSAGDIEILPGQMIIHFPVGKTTIEPGEYESLELVIVFSLTQPKIWWDGKMTVNRRSVQVV